MEIDIETHFNQHFSMIECRSAATVRRCQRLRYTVLCDEHHYLSPEDYPEHWEADIYDASSVHLLIQHKASNVDIATVRLILYDKENVNKPFPIEKFDILRRLKRDQQWKVDRKSIGEISRFSISKTFRRRAEEVDVIHGITSQVFSQKEAGRRHIADITLGLFRAIVATSEKQQLEYFYALMEPSLIRLLYRFGIVFNTIGPVVNCYGLRQPCVSKIETILRGLYYHKRETWEFITDNGKYYGVEYINKDTMETA